MKGINWLMSKVQIVENEADYTVSAFTGTLQRGMIRDMLAYCKEQGARYIDGRSGSGYNLTIEERDGYRKAIVLFASSTCKVDFQIIEEREV